MCAAAVSEEAATATGEEAARECSTGPQHGNAARGGSGGDSGGDSRGTQRGKVPSLAAIGFAQLDQDHIALNTVL